MSSIIRLSQIQDIWGVCDQKPLSRKKKKCLKIKPKVIDNLIVFGYGLRCSPSRLIRASLMSFKHWISSHQCRCTASATAKASQTK